VRHDTSGDVDADARDALARLLHAARDGDLGAFETFYARTIRQVAPSVRRICGTPHFEDALAEAYFQAWRSLATFDSARAGALTWIKMIACSRARDIMRCERVRHGGADGAPLHDGLQEPDTAPGPEESLQAAQTRAKVHAAIDLLPARQRMLVSMTYYAENSHSEIASMTGLAAGSVKHSMELAHQRLGSALTPLKPLRQP
jgi:RNA polymerase sigma-70 factor (ECF subfamily)